MRDIATNGVAWLFGLCLSVGHVREPCENGETDRDAVCGLTRPRKHVLDGARDLLLEWAVLGGCPDDSKAL